jgi:hypothetical protein
MATMAKQRATTNFLDDARNLIDRVLHGEAFGRYLAGRKERIALLVALCVTLSIGCASGVILFVLGMRPILVLLAVLAVPFVLLGSLAMLLYALFSWLENVALVAALHHGKPTVPQLPWPLVAAFVGVPFLLLLVRAPVIAIVLGAMAAGGPFLYLHFERRKR